MHIDTTAGLVKMSAIVVSAIGVAVGSFYDSAATTIGIVAAGVIIGLGVATLLGAALASFRRSHHVGTAAPAEVEPFALTAEPSEQ